MHPTIHTMAISFRSVIDSQSSHKLPIEAGFRGGRRLSKLLSLSLSSRGPRSRLPPSCTKPTLSKLFGWPCLPLFLMTVPRGRFGYGTGRPSLFSQGIIRSLGPPFSMRNQYFSSSSFTCFYRSHVSAKKSETQGLPACVFISLTIVPPLKLTRATTADSVNRALVTAPNAAPAHQ
jgi:hypothetical protein